MKEALALCSLALNPSAPSPTASMVKLEDGFMVAFGGTFCIRVPLEVDIKACFSPSKAAVFFRRPRAKVSYTLQKNKLILKEGKEKLSIPYLDADEMTTLDVLSKPQPCAVDMGLLKVCADVINADNSRLWAQGVSFRNGVMESTNNSIIVSAISGLEDDAEFNLPLASVKALARFKSKVVSVATDQRAVKFYFADGSSLTSVSIVEQMVDTSAFFKSTWSKCSLDEKIAMDLISLECNEFTFENDHIKYKDEDLEGVIAGGFSKRKFRISHEHLTYALRVGHDIRLSECGSRIMSVSENCRIIAGNRV